MITTGVTIIFIGLIIMMGLESVFNEYFRNTLFGADEILSSIFLLLITIAVSILVYAGLQKKNTTSKITILHMTKNLRNIKEAG